MVFYLPNEQRKDFGKLLLKEVMKVIKHVNKNNRR